MIKQNRFVALIGEGRERFTDAELDQEWPTEPVVIDAYGVSDAYRYDGFVFLNENWFTKYSKDWNIDSSKIDKLLTDLVRCASPRANSENLMKIKSYLTAPPETIEEAVDVWKTFYDPDLRSI